MRFYKRFTTVLCVLFLIFSFVCTAIPAEAVSGPTITTTLTDNIVQRGSKKTFDVWAGNSAGNKIKATVRLNGQTVDPTWDDNDKTSYTLIFTKEGENIVTVSASSDGGKKKELTYHITYQKAGQGETIGTATWSVELFTVGCGYLIYPVEMQIREGETAAEQLIRLLHNNGFVGYYNGTPKSAFYLGYIADGTASGVKYNNYTKSGTPQNPKKLNLSPSVPSLLVPYLNDTMTFFDPEDYKNNWVGYIGEFVFTNGSGWMYSVNNNFPNVGFADTYLSDGDVVRVQFTLAYGADIGGLGSVGSSNIPGVDNQPESGFYAVANKDALNKTISKALSSGLMSRDNVKKAYETALSVMKTLNASQSSVNNAVSELNNALENPSKDTGTVPSETPSSAGSSSGSGNSGSTGGSAGSGNPGNTSHSSVSGNKGNIGGTFVTTGQIGSTSGTNISAGTESDIGANAVDSSVSTQDSSDSETKNEDNLSELNNSNSFEDTDGNNSVTKNDKINTDTDGGKKRHSPVNPVIIAVVTVSCAAFITAVIIVIYVRNKKTKAVGDRKEERSNTND